MLRAVKFADGSDDVIEGPGMPFGGPFNGQDLYREHFSKATDFALSWFPADGGRPLLYHHSLDSDIGLAPVGRVKSYEVKADIGVWTKAQLDKSSEYFSAIKDLVSQGKLFFSSGAMAHLVEVDTKSGEIKRWPWVELSLTPTPANPLARIDFATAARHYKSAGIELPAPLRVIRHEGDQWVLYSQDGAKKLGSFDTEEEAKEREREIEFFKHEDSAKASLHATSVARGQGCIDNATRAINEEAFWSHVDKGEGDNAHWLWTGAKNTKGYGILEVDGQTVRAHRVAYEMAHGAIPDGKDVGHKTECATTSCVRASHLELVTNAENAAERAEREAASKAVTMAQMREMVADMDMDMSDAEMRKMVDAFPDHDEATMRKALQTRKQMGKSSPPLRAVSWEDVRQECAAMLNARMAETNMMMAPGQGAYCYVEETYSDHVICCVHQGGQERYYSIPFARADDGHVESMGSPTEVEETYTPVNPGMPMGNMPMEMHAEMVRSYAASLVERTKDLRQRRLKEGRMISDSNRRRLMACMEQMSAAMTEMQSLLDSSAPQPAKAAALRRQADYLTLWAATQLEQN